MRITKISVKGLFGYLDHEIPLNQESRITIIHGPNGVGKTVLMRMVHSLFNFEYEFLGKIPFGSLTVEFDNRTGIHVANVESHSRLLIGKGDLSFPSEDLKSFLSEDVKFRNSFPFPIENWEFMVTPTDDTVFMLRTSVDKYEELLPIAAEVLGSGYIHFEAGTNSYWLEIFSDDRSVEDQLAEEDPRILDKMLTVIDLLETYPEIHNEVYGEMPDWFARIRQDIKLWLIDTRRLVSDVVDIGALKEHYFYDAYSVYAIPTIESATMEIYSKIADSSRLHNERQLFEQIINERLLFKSVAIGDEGLIIFNEDGDGLLSCNLSSGEQQLLILYYQLLFETEPETLVMIDEPELSMNVVWQRNFLKDLQRIIELRKFDVLIATHSPQIIHDKWDWMVPLGEKVDD